MPTADEVDLPTQQEIERETQKLNTAVKVMIALALAKQLESPQVPRGPDVDVIEKALIVTAFVFLMVRRKYDIDLDAIYGASGRSQYAQRIAETASRWSRDHTRTLHFQTPSAQKRRDWERAAAQSLTTHIMSSTLADVADELNRNVPRNKQVKKVWVTRGDHRVRNSHIRLHGRSHRLRTPFRVWSATGHRLMYPGDLSAPLSETINCRCYLWLTRGTAEQIQEIVGSAAIELDLTALNKFFRDYTVPTAEDLFPDDLGAQDLYKEQIKTQIGITVQR